MPTGRTGPERECALNSHDDCKLSCYYQNHPLSPSLHKALVESSRNYKIRLRLARECTKIRIFGPQN